MNSGFRKTILRFKNSIKMARYQLKIEFLVGSAELLSREIEANNAANESAEKEKRTSGSKDAAPDEPRRSGSEKTGEPSSRSKDGRERPQSRSGNSRRRHERNFLGRADQQACAAHGAAHDGPNDGPPEAEDPHVPPTTCLCLSNVDPHFMDANGRLLPERFGTVSMRERARVYEHILIRKLQLLHPALYETILERLLARTDRDIISMIYEEGLLIEFAMRCVRQLHRSGFSCVLPAQKTSGGSKGKK